MLRDGSHPNLSIASHSASKAEIKYRPDIDGLRAIAVLLVVLFHAFPDLVPGGFIGVDVFFVISGFLISSILFKQLSRYEERGDNTSPQISSILLDFYGRRIKRIFPALSVVLIALYAVGWFNLLADEFAQLGKHIAGGAGFVANLVLLSEVGYFDNSAETKPLLHLWSLGIEEQFYIFFPLALVFVRRWRFGFVALISSCLVLSFLANLVWIEAHRSAVFYLPFTRMWELLIGSSLALLAQHWILSSKRLGAAFGLIGLGLIFYSAFTLSRASIFPGCNALFPTLGVALVVVTGGASVINRLFLSNRFLVGVGLISYPLYLWHWPMLSMARILGNHSVYARSGCVALSFILAGLTYALIERPIRFKARGVGIVIALFVSMIVIGGVGWVTYLRDGAPGRSAHARYGVKADQLLLKPPPVPFADCPVEVNNKELRLTYCSVSSSSAPRAAIIGDSHAEDRFHGLAKLDPKRPWILLGQNSCPPLRGIDVVSDHPGCRQKNEGIFNYLINQPQIKTVALSFFNAVALDNSYAADHIIRNGGPNKMPLRDPLNPQATKIDLFKNGLEDSVKTLLDAGKEVIIIVDVPELPFLPRDCVRDDTECVLEVKKVRERQAKFREVFIDIQQRYPKLAIYDPLPVISFRNKIMYTYEGKLLYFDSHHLTGWGSELVMQDFLKWLEQRGL